MLYFKVEELQVRNKKVYGCIFIFNVGSDPINLKVYIQITEKHFKSWQWTWKITKWTAVYDLVLYSVQGLTQVTNNENERQPNWQKYVLLLYDFICNVGSDPINLKVYIQILVTSCETENERLPFFANWQQYDLLLYGFVLSAWSDQSNHLVYIQIAAMM